MTDTFDRGPQNHPPSTEQALPASAGLDAMSLADAVALMNAQDAVAVAAVATERANVVKAIELVAAAFDAGGRLIYFGAGTSGRLGVLDASECPPTFRTPAESVQGVIAGGPAAMFVAQEGAEDDAAAGAAAVDERRMGPIDVAFGIAASGSTPFVWGALRRARELGTKTIFLACVPAVASEPAVDVQIRPITGPEVLTGSTRLKAGTATKLVLNQVTTLAMVRVGKTYGNLMVDVKASNAKLRDRAVRLVSGLTGLSPAASVALLAAANGHVKTAVVMHHARADVHAAVARLARHGNRLRETLEDAAREAPPSAGRA